MKTKQQAREYAAKLYYELASTAHDKDFGFASHVTDKDKDEYASKQLELANQIERGELDHIFSIQQSMHYFLTGECVPLLKSERQ